MTLSSSPSPVLSSKPLPASLPGIRVLWTDMDGTLTTGGALPAPVVQALYRLAEKMEIVLVTGRPAGWAQGLLQLLPFSAAIAENGAVYFVKEPKGAQRAKGFLLTEPEREMWRGKMEKAHKEACKKWPQLRLSSDSSYREVDLAYDWNEEESLPEDVADLVQAHLIGHGLDASRSSVHINFGPKGLDKGGAIGFLSSTIFPNISPEQFVYVGDSLNDSSAFELLPKTVGVENLRDRAHELNSHPRWVTPSREGEGFLELAKVLLND